MISPVKKLFLILIAVIALTGIVLGREIKRAASISIKTTNVPIVSDYAVNLPTDAIDPMLGNPGAALTLVEFTDLNCRECASVHADLYNFVNKHPQEARLIWKDAPAPNILWQNNNTRHESAFCAIEQNQFWKFVELAFSPKNDPAKIAQSLGLNMEKWQACAASDATKQKISMAADIARNLGIGSAPAIFVNNKFINLTKDINLSQLLNSFIAK